MNEFVYAEFLFHPDDIEKGHIQLAELGADFRMIDSNQGNFSVFPWYRVCGEINAQAATILSLRNKFLADSMRISYIPTVLKDKYRT